MRIEVNWRLDKPPKKGQRELIQCPGEEGVEPEFTILESLMEYKVLESWIENLTWIYLWIYTTNLKKGAEYWFQQKLESDI